MPNLHTLHPDQKFAQLSNESIDDLTLIGAGYLANLLRHTDGWVPSLTRLVEQKKVGRDLARTARKELVRKGYYVKVLFKYDGGRNFSDIWRAVHPHTSDDLDLIASYYQRGATWQIPKKDENGRHLRDSRGHTLQQPVTIQWAEMESWRGDAEHISDPADPEDPNLDEISEIPGQYRGSETRPPEGEPRGGFPAPGEPAPGEPAPGEPTPIEKTGENTSEKTGENPTEPFGDPQKVPDLQKGYRETPGHFDNGETCQGDLVSNPLHARAREAELKVIQILIS